MKKVSIIVTIAIIAISFCIITVLLLYNNKEKDTTVSEGQITHSTETIMENIIPSVDMLEEQSPTNESEPEGVDLSDFYGEGSTQLSDSVILVTDSRAVDFVIEKLLEENSYTSCKVLEQWHDNVLNAECYYVLLSDEFLYCIKEDAYGQVYYSLDDYNYYLEVNCE